MHVLSEKGTTEPQALSRGEKIELALIMLLAAALRAAFLLHQSLTEDEVKDLQIAHKPLSGIFSFSDGFPPLYNSILHVWLGFTSSPYAGRWLGVIFGVIAVGLLWQVGRRLAGPTSAGSPRLLSPHRPSTSGIRRKAAPTRCIFLLAWPGFWRWSLHSTPIAGAIGLATA